MGRSMDMTQVAWAALGLLAVVVFGMFGMFFYLGAKIESGHEALGSRIDSLAARLDSRIDSLGAQLQSHIERHDA
jgi:hypothetical protein